MALAEQHGGSCRWRRQCRMEPHSTCAPGTALELTPFQNAPHPYERRPMTTRTRVIAGLLILLAAFLIGFVPQYMDKVRLRNELRTSGEQVMSLGLDLRMAELRDLCGMMLLEVQGQNYGLAREF